MHDQWRAAADRARTRRPNGPGAHQSYPSNLSAKLVASRTGCTTRFTRRALTWAVVIFAPDAAKFSPAATAIPGRKRRKAGAQARHSIATGRDALTAFAAARISEEALAASRRQTARLKWRAVFVWSNVMVDIRFDTYYDYAELSRVLRELTASYPRLMQLQSIGRSFEGRDIWLATLTNTDTGPAAAKPALWVDGNIHATELAGSMACLYLLHHFLTQYGRDEDVTRCLDTRACYVCPRVNPDGAQWALAPVPRLIRSSVRPYPYDEEPVDGLQREDVDGDGRVLSMRIRDPNGPWRISEHDARLLVRRAPAEVGGDYFRLLPEGRFDRYDGRIIKLQPRKEGLDLNRNFPASWRQEHEQQGAGRFPASEPEVRAVVEFVTAHRNITSAVAFHTYSGVLLRPYSHLADEALPVDDLWTYQKIGAKGTLLTGYPNISVFHDFRYHPKEVITGSFDDWMYEHSGVFAWTVEIWSPQRQAGIGEYKFIEWYREHPVEDDLKLLKWNDEVLGGQGFIDWYAFDHPQLGAVELGGWDTLYTWSNPPPALLEQEIARFP